MAASSRAGKMSTSRLRGVNHGETGNLPLHSTALTAPSFMKEGVPCLFGLRCLELMQGGVIGQNRRSFDFYLEFTCARESAVMLGETRASIRIITGRYVKGGVGVQYHKRNAATK